MRVIVQRCRKGKVEVNNKLINKIDAGLVLLVGFTEEDSNKEIDKLVKKVVNLRIFDDENGIMNKSIIDVKGKILSISQFTLYADTKKGNRPSYIKALNGEKAIKLYDKFNEELNKYVETVTGIFGANMQLFIQNDGPITIALEA